MVKTGRLKVKWLADGSESDFIPTDRLHANACCTKNLQGQLPIDLAVARGEQHEVPRGEEREPAAHTREAVA